MFFLIACEDLMVYLLGKLESVVKKVLFYDSSDYRPIGLSLCRIIFLDFLRCWYLIPSTEVPGPCWQFGSLDLAMAPDHLGCTGCHANPPFSGG